MSNNRKHSFYGRALLMVLLGVLLLGASLTVGRISARPEKVAARIAGRIDKRVKILDGFMEQMASSTQEWTHLEKFVGVGEKADDLMPFVARDFVEALL